MEKIIVQTYCTGSLQFYYKINRKAVSKDSRFVDIMIQDASSLFNHFKMPVDRSKLIEMNFDLLKRYCFFNVKLYRYAEILPREPKIH